jgi:hypothetical protein
LSQEPFQAQDLSLSVQALVQRWFHNDRSIFVSHLDASNEKAIATEVGSVSGVGRNFIGQRRPISPPILQG